MSDQDRERWDARYEADPGAGTPSRLIRDHFSLAATGRALDLACGNGRNSLFLAEQGFEVDAVDISSVAVKRLAGRHSAVHALRVDLDTWDIPEAAYDLIANIKFLDRRLFPMILKGLKPGGVLIFESFTDDAGDDPYCLKSNELLHAFLNLRVVYYAETQNPAGARFKGTAALVGISARIR